MDELVTINVFEIELQILKEYKDLADDLDRKFKKVKNSICSKSIDKDANKLLKYIRGNLVDNYVKTSIENNKTNTHPDDVTNQIIEKLLPINYNKFIDRYIGGIYALD